MRTNAKLDFTGERFVPEMSGNIELEHMHRYIYALAYAKGKTILDIASGEGYGTALLATQAAFVTGVDIAEDAVVHARQKYRLPNLEFRLGSCSKIPLPDHTVDFVVSFETIEHHDEHEQMLAEIKRVLKPYGMVVVSSPDKAIYTDKPDYHNPFHVKELYRDEFEALFRIHFKNVVSLGQKVMFGSGIIPCGEGSHTAFTSVDMGATTSNPGLAEAMYNLVLASDAMVPAAQPSFLDVGIDASETVMHWRAAVAQREGDVQRLRCELQSTQSRLQTTQSRLQTTQSELQASRGELQAMWRQLAISTERTQRLNEQVQRLNAHVQRLNKRSFWQFVTDRKDRFEDSECLDSNAVTILLSPFFDADWYLARYPDVAESNIEPARHYSDFGGKEGRQPGPLFDGPWYLAQNPDVSAAGINPLVHYMKYGWAEGRAIRVTASGRTLKTPGLSNVSESGDLKTHFLRQCTEALTAFFAKGDRIKLPTSEFPDVSIILVLFNGAELTFQSLESLTIAIDVPAEVIVVDNASSDRTRELLARVDGATIIQNSKNLHFLRAVNQAAPKARGRYILLLNNDTSLKAGPISIARDVLDENAKIGAVGGKIILLDGTLQEAGSIIWQDGVCLGYGRGRHPSEPEFQFRRDVDYCSGAFLMLRRDLFEQLGWLNERFIPAYYEETDLCMRIRAAGYRVVYEPRVEVSHFEFGSSTSSDAALALQQRNHTTFKKLHQKQLECGHLPSATPPLEARLRSTSQRILIIDDRVPYPELGAGYPRATEIIRAVHAAGWFITFYPTFPDVSWERAYRLLPRDIEIMADHGEYRLALFLRERIGYYDAVLVSRPHNMKSFRRACKAVPEFLERTHLIYDAEAIFTAREALRVALKSRPFTENEYRDKLAEEIALVDDAKAIIAVSEQEASVFRKHCQSSVHVVGHRLNPKPTRRPFEARANILFVGALDGSQEVSPNVDGLVWFVHEVMPLLDKHLGDSYKLLVAGRVESDDVRALAGRRVEFHGVVPDLEFLYDRAQLFIAPTRFAAGIPHKVQEASAAGLPVVTTQLVAAQLNRSDLVDILTADTPTGFSEACYRLYTEPALWKRIRESALEAVVCECDGSRFDKSVTAVLLDVPPLHRNACSEIKATANQASAPVEQGSAVRTFIAASADPTNCPQSEGSSDGAARVNEV